MRGERTPATIPLSPDVQHHVALELPGHAPWAQDVAVSPGEVRQLEAALEPLPGTVDLVSNPPGAEVWTDGRRTGLNTPVVLGPVAAGPHVVTLRMEGYGVEVGVPP